MKNSFEEEIIKNTRSSIHYLLKQIEDLQESEPILREVASILDKREEVLREEATHLYSNFIFEVASPEKSFKLTSSLLEIFPQITKFEKVFDVNSVDQPRWKWVASFKQRSTIIHFIVSPASPDENCQPVRHVHNYSTWSCNPR